MPLLHSGTRADADRVLDVGVAALIRCATAPRRGDPTRFGIDGVEFKSATLPSDRTGP